MPLSIVPLLYRYVQAFLGRPAWRYPAPAIMAGRYRPGMPWSIRTPDIRNPRSWTKMPEGAHGALQGLKVIDLSRVLGGPYCGQMLADHGAEVIKVEPPQGDETRLWGPPFDHEGISAYFAGINRNKRTVALDLSRPEGRTVLLKLLEGADVLIENFKTGTMEKWGVGYDELAKRFPTL